METTDEEIGALSDDAIAGSWRIYQRVRGHRYSLDDVATAWEAASARPAAERVADLGCGIGSVTLMLAYKLQRAQIVGIEAQPMSLELARRNVARNALDGRVTLHHGDLRDEGLRDRLGGGLDLVTGTPPYFDPKKSSPSTDAQRTYARIEMRGGIEAYVQAGARLLGEGGALVVCGDAKRPERAIDGAAAAGLVAISRRDVVPRAGKGALFTIWTFGRPTAGASEVNEIEDRDPIVARDADGGRTPMAHALRRFFDLPVNEEEPASPQLRERRAR